MKRVFLIWADGLNEYAALMDAGEQVRNHRPPHPGYWFNALARDLRDAYLNAPGLRALLTDSALCKLSCPGDCYACAFDRHDLCAWDCAVGQREAEAVAA